MEGDKRFDIMIPAVSELSRCHPLFWIDLRQSQREERCPVGVGIGVGVKAIIKLCPSNHEGSSPAILPAARESTGRPGFPSDD